MSSVASIILNAQLLSQRLKNRESDVDRILAGAEEVNNQLETMRQVKSSFFFYVALSLSLFLFRCTSNTNVSTLSNDVRSSSSKTTWIYWIALPETDPTPKW